MTTETENQTVARLAVDAAKANHFMVGDTPMLQMGGTLVSLEQYMDFRTRFRGTFKTGTISDFAKYVTDNKGGAGFIDTNECTATVYLNLGGSANPGHGDWRALLNMEKTAGYAAVLKAHGSRFDQRGFVEWVEDWAANLNALHADGSSATIAAVLPALRELTIAQKREVTHTDRDLGATRSALDDIEAKSRHSIPTHLVFTTEPYAQFEKRSFQLRLSVMTGEKPTIGLRIVGKEVITESIAAEFKELLQKALGDSTSLLLGQFTP
jgi:uncharacterized protein YfdQ (DUF2303 family)